MQCYLYYTKIALLHEVRRCGWQPCPEGKSNIIEGCLNPHLTFLLRMDWLERSTNGLKGRLRKKASQNQCPVIFDPVFFDNDKAFTLNRLLLPNQLLGV